MVSESVAQVASLPRGVGACIHTLPESVVSLIPWRPRCSEEAAVPLGRPQSRKRCSNARDVCCTRQQTGDLCADPFLRFRQCGSCRPQVISFCGRVGRIASQARQGGRPEEKENFESNGCARRTHVVRSSALGRRPTRGGESARTRWSCGGARPPNFQDRRCTGLFEQQVPVKSVFAQTR